MEQVKSILQAVLAVGRKLLEANVVFLAGVLYGSMISTIVSYLIINNFCRP
jgi:hypothetical protein